MDLYEYQARDMFEKHQVNVLPGILAHTPEEVYQAAEKLTGTVVVKAQVKIGGRGKAGGVKLAHDPSQAQEVSESIFGLNIKDHIVKKVMVAGGAKIVKEFYFSILLDRTNRSYLCLASAEGGVEIEQLAKEKPDALARVEIDPSIGFTEEIAKQVIKDGAFDESLSEKLIPFFQKIYQVFVDEDASLVEINPLILDEAGEIIALDGKVTLDENAGFRHPEHENLVDKDEENPIEAKAKAADLNYVKLDGEVGIIGNGAGLVMSTLDVVAYAGESHANVKAANFLDIGGGANSEVMATGLEIILNDPQVKSVFVNVFGGITSCDAVANGIVDALGILGDSATKPLVVRLDGNNVQLGREILQSANHPLVTIVDSMDEAASKAAELANS